MSPDKLKQLMVDLHMRPVAVYPAYIKLTGSLEGGVMLSQLMYWSSAVHGREFYKTDAEMREETCLTKRELLRAKEAIRNINAVTVCVRGIPARTFYKINYNRLVDLLSESSSCTDAVTTGCSDADKTGCTDAVTAITETTTETTTDTNTYIDEPSETKDSIVEVEIHQVAKFEECWKAFGRYGAKGKALAYWKKLSNEEREAVQRAIPAYMAVVKGGRYQKQFEGWINPVNRLWEMNYGGRTAAPSKWNGISLDDI